MYSKAKTDGPDDCIPRRCVVAIFTIGIHDLASRQFLGLSSHALLSLNSPPSEFSQSGNKLPHRLQIDDLIGVAHMSMEDTFCARFGQRQKMQVASCTVRTRVLEQVTEYGNDSGDGVEEKGPGGVVREPGGDRDEPLGGGHTRGTPR